MIEEFSKDIQNYVKSKLLQPGDELTLADTQKGIFISLPERYRGRLSADPTAPGALPGRYIDRSRVLAEQDGKKLYLAIDEITLDPITAAQRLAQLSPGYQYINLAPDKLADLPETTHMEGDIVSLTDKDHTDYSLNPDDNQFTVYRVYYETTDMEIPTLYRLRAGKKQFDATEDQIKFIAAGPVRLFYSGEGFKLLWKSEKAEAEFHLLLGRFNRIFNPVSKSYLWDLATAKQVVSLGKAHSVLQVKDTYYLVNFWDIDIARQLASCSDIILDI